MRRKLIALGECDYNRIVHGSNTILTLSPFPPSFTLASTKISGLSLHFRLYSRDVNPDHFSWSSNRYFQWLPYFLLLIPKSRGSPIILPLLILLQLIRSCLCARLLIKSIDGFDNSVIDAQKRSLFQSKSGAVRSDSRRLCVLGELSGCAVVSRMRMSEHLPYLVSVPLTRSWVMSPRPSAIGGEIPVVQLRIRIKDIEVGMSFPQQSSIPKISHDVYILYVIRYALTSLSLISSIPATDFKDHFPFCISLKHFKKIALAPAA